MMLVYVAKMLETTNTRENAYLVYLVPQGPRRSRTTSQSSMHLVCWCILAEVTAYRSNTDISHQNLMSRNILNSLEMIITH